MSESNLKECEEILKERMDITQALCDQRQELQTTLAKEAVLKEDVERLERQQVEVIEKIEHALPQLNIQEVIQFIDEKERPSIIGNIHFACKGTNLNFILLQPQKMKSAAILLCDKCIGGVDEPEDFCSGISFNLGGFDAATDYYYRLVDVNLLVKNTSNIIAGEIIEEVSKFCASSGIQHIFVRNSIYPDTVLNAPNECYLIDLKEALEGWAGRLLRFIGGVE